MLFVKLVGVRSQQENVRLTRDVFLFCATNRVGLCKKVVMLLFCSLFVFGLLLVEPVVAPVTVPVNPSSGPEVSVVIYNNPIWVPPEDHVNSYTGEILYTTPGGYAFNGSIVITIKNSPFTPYTDKDGNTINQYYTVFLKALSHDVPWGNNLRPRLALYQSDAANTVITFTYDGAESSKAEHIYVVWEETVVDFRIQAVTGHFYRGTESYYDAVYEGEGSAFTDFSVKLPLSDKPGISKPYIPPSSVVPSTSDSSNSSPQSFWSSTLIITLATVCIITIPIAIVTYHYGKRKTRSSQTNQNTI